MPRGEAAAGPGAAGRDLRPPGPPGLAPDGWGKRPRVSHAARVSLSGGPLPDPVPDVRRLAVLRSGGLGDLLSAEPALAALRATYPDAEITLLGAAQHGPLVTERPGPWDRFVAVPQVPGVRVGPGPDSPAREVEAWCEERRAEGYDLAVQMHGGGGRSNGLLLRLGARVTAGTATPDAPRLDRTVPYAFNQHETVRWLEVAEACGAPLVRLDPHLAATDADAQQADAALAEAGVTPDRPLVALHPGATDARRRWPLDRWAAALEESLAGTGARVAVLGGPDDRSLTAPLAGELGRRCVDHVDLTCATGMPGLVGLLRRADLFVGNDSGPRWIAHAVGTPTVSVITRANLADVAPLRRTAHRVAVDWDSGCRLCGRGVDDGWCGHGDTATAGVGVAEVAGLVGELWSEVAPPGALR